MLYPTWVHIHPKYAWHPRLLELCSFRFFCVPPIYVHGLYRYPTCNILLTHACIIHVKPVLRAIEVPNTACKIWVSTKSSISQLFWCCCCSVLLYYLWINMYGSEKKCTNARTQRYKVRKKCVQQTEHSSYEDIGRTRTEHNVNIINNSKLTYICTYV